VTARKVVTVLGSSLLASAAEVAMQVSVLPDPRRPSKDPLDDL
jgi:hypothetical protein